MRLYSYGYRKRGVGFYCSHVASALLPFLRADHIYIWGNPELLPDSIQTDNTTIIPYLSGSWKRSVVDIPFIVSRHNIDLVHYWIALGPIHPIGLSPVPFAPAIATIHDLGVEKWDTPYGISIRKRPFWKMQKLFFSTIDGVICNSSATHHEVRSSFISSRPGVVVYPPYSEKSATAETSLTSREPFFIALGGSPHKNCARTIAAFSRFKSKFPEYSLRILGDLNPAEEHLPSLPEGVIHEPRMNNYHRYLDSCGGLLSLSLNEGLGIPPIEALSHSCPLLLSSIPVHQETCSEAALFADPYNVEAISEAMSNMAVHNTFWIEQSQKGASRYQLRAQNSISNCLALYRYFTPDNAGK